MSSSNLTPEYVEYVDGGGKIELLVQELIDRAQYHEGFLNFLQELVKEYDAPFEWVNTETGRVRQIKLSFIKKESTSKNFIEKAIELISLKYYKGDPIEKLDNFIAVSSDSELQDDYQQQDILLVGTPNDNEETFLARADEIYKRNVGRLFLAVQHAAFPNGLLELGRHFSDIFTTGKPRDSYEDQIKEVQRVQNVPELADAFYYKGRPFQLHIYTGETHDDI